MYSICIIVLSIYIYINKYNWNLSPIDTVPYFRPETSIIVPDFNISMYVHCTVLYSSSCYYLYSIDVVS